jgi:hypothetical protein
MRCIGKICRRRELIPVVPNTAADLERLTWRDHNDALKLDTRATASTHDVHQTYPNLRLALELKTVGKLLSLAIMMNLDKNKFTS